MSKTDLFIQEHFPSAMPTIEQRVSGDVSDERFFPDLTEEQFNNIPDEIREVILTSYPHLKKYCKHETPTDDEHLDVAQLRKTLTQIEAFLDKTRELLIEEIRALNQNDRKTVL
jgi:hypothetical protein